LVPGRGKRDRGPGPGAGRRLRPAWRAAVALHDLSPALDSAAPALGAMTKLLPAAAEFQSEARQIDLQRPPRILHATLYTLLALIATAVAWAWVAKVDRIVVARGKLVTTAATIVVQPLEISVVHSLDAKVGDTVRKGEALATLDPTFSQADAAQLRDRIQSLSAQIGRLQAEIEERRYAPAALDPEARLQLTIWTQTMEQYRAKLDSFDQQIRHVEAEIATRNADHALLERNLGVAREVEEMYHGLYQKQFGSKVQWLSAESQRMQIERDMERAHSERLESEQRLKGVQ